MVERSKFTDSQIAFILRRADEVTAVAEVRPPIRFCAHPVN